MSMPGFGDVQTWGGRHYDLPEDRDPPTEREIAERVSIVIERLGADDLGEMIVYHPPALAAQTALVWAIARRSDIDTVVAKRALDRAIRAMPALRDMAISELTNRADE